MLSNEEKKFVHDSHNIYDEFLTLFEKDYLLANKKESLKYIVIVYERAKKMIMLSDEDLFKQIKEDEAELLLLEFTEVMIKYKKLIQKTNSNGVDKS